MLPLFLLVALAIAAPAAAQAKKGDTELQVFANFSMAADDTDTATGLIFVNAGKFVTDTVQAGGGVNVLISASDADLGVNAFVRKYFGMTKVQPYVGGEFLQFSVKNPDFSYAQVIAGAKNYISERVAIDFKGAYGFLIQEPSQALISFNVGVSVIF
jgi:hypothetical protein